VVAVVVDTPEAARDSGVAGGCTLVLGILALVASATTSSCVSPAVPVETQGGASETAGNCVSSGGPTLWWIIAFVIIAAGPLLVGTYLYRAAGRQSESI
jgi:hypothetical protein